MLPPSVGGFRDGGRQFRHPDKPGTVTVAGKLGNDLKRGTLASIFRQAGLTDTVDVVILNEAPVALAYRVVREGEVVFCRDERGRIEHWATVVDRYLDMEPTCARFLERRLSPAARDVSQSRDIHVVLGPAGCRFHADQIVDSSNDNRHAVDLDLDRSLA